MGSVPPLLTFLLMVVSGWVHRRQLIVIEFLQAENRMLKERYPVVLALFGIGIGLAVGAVRPVLLGSALKDVLPVPANFGLYPLPLPLPLP